MSYHSIKIHLCTFCWLMASWQMLCAKEYDHSTMSVQGYSIIRKPADELQLTLGVVSQSTTAKEALNINNQKIIRVLEKLQQLGLKSSEYQTSQFRITPLYTVPPKNPPPDWMAAINGYEVTNQITIRTDQTALAGIIIDATSQDGVNTVTDISFHLKNHRDYHSEAVALATQYALEDAQQLAQAANVQLLRILEITLDPAHPQNSQRMSLYAMKSMDMSNSANAIVVGEIDITAQVNIVYEIH